MTNLDLVTQQMWAAMTSGLTAFQQQQTAGLTGAAALAAQAAESVYLATGGTQTTYRVKTDADLPTTGVSNGQTALVLTTGDLYLRDAGAWAKQSTLPTLAGIQARGLRTGELQTPDRRLRVPLISVQLDDGYLTDKTVVAPIFAARGMKFTFCVITSVADDPAQAGFMRWPDIQALVAAGHEANSHTVNHVRIDSLTPAQLHYECAESIRVMRSHGINPTSLVYPQAYHSAESRAIVRQYYRAGIAGIEPTEQNSAPLRSFAVARRPIQNARTLAQYKADVDKCLAEGTWLVFIIHTGYDLDATQQANLGELLDYIQSKQIRVCTINEGLDVYGNLYESGDTAGTQWTAVTAQGDMVSSAAPKQRLAPVPNKLATDPTVTVNNATPLSAFELGTRTVNIINSSGGMTGLPSASGILITDRTAPDGVLYPLYCWQEWMDYSTSKRWRRKPLTSITWADWEPMDAVVIRAELNTYASSVTPNLFPQGKITRLGITAAGSAGFPSSAGMLEVDTTVPVAAGAKFTRQLFIDYATGAVSMRQAKNATEWEASWVPVSGAAAGVLIGANINAYAASVPPSGFPAGKITHYAVNSSGNAGYPSSAGTVDVDTTVAIASGARFTRQTWTDYATGAVSVRVAKNASEWEAAWVAQASGGAGSTVIAAANAFTAASTPADFADSKITYVAVTAASSTGFPTSSGGLLVVDRTTSLTVGAKYVRQRWTDYATGRVYTRPAANAGAWDTKWTLMNAAFMLPANTLTNAATYDQFPEGVVSYTTWTAGGVAAGFPTNSGTLKVDRTGLFVDAAYAIYVRAEWRDAATGKEWHKSATSGGWTPWLAVAYGVNVFKHSVTLDLPSIAADDQYPQDFTYNGITTNAVIVVNASGLEAGLFVRAEIPTDNTIRLIVYNARAAAIDPSNRTFKFRVIQ